MHSHETNKATTENLDKQKNMSSLFQLLGNTFSQTFPSGGAASGPKIESMAPLTIPVRLLRVLASYVSSFIPTLFHDKLSKVVESYPQKDTCM